MYVRMNTKTFLCYTFYCNMQKSTKAFYFSKKSNTMKTEEEKKKKMLQ